MKVAIDKNFVTLAALPKVKEDIKEFKSRYTDGDLLLRFVDNTGFVQPYNGEILKTNVEAFSGGVYENGTQFHVSMVVDCLSGGFAVIDFYCNMDLEIDLRDSMYDITMYRRA